MIYYFLPGPGIYGGIKVACQFLEMLISLGAKGAIVLPDGKAPQWFRSKVPVLNENQVLTTLDQRDWIMITWPPDYHRLKEMPGKLVCHCQGTDPLMDPVFADREVIFLTCWEQAARHARQKFNRQTIDVGISIANCFFWDGIPKIDNRVAYMPRRGFPIVNSCIRSCRKLDFMPIDGLDELSVSNLLKRSGIFLATAVGEQFGLPALEAMAAGCLVLSVPVKGGMEYLIDGKNCLVVDPGDIPEKLRWITQEKNTDLRIHLRNNAMATAARYRFSKQRCLLQAKASSELKGLVS